MGYNSRLYGFNEIGKRSYEEILKENSEKVEKLDLLQEVESDTLSEF